MKSSLQPGMHRAQVRLDKLLPGAVILDGLGHAWQSDYVYWYRAYGDGEAFSSWDVAQVIDGTFTVLHPEEVL